MGHDIAAELKDFPTEQLCCVVDRNDPYIYPMIPPVSALPSILPPKTLQFSIVNPGHAKAYPRIPPTFSFPLILGLRSEMFLNTPVYENPNNPTFEVFSLLIFRLEIT